MDYSKTLNLPQTEFPMKASLPVREPHLMKFWEDNRIYQAVAEKNKAKPKRILHDGPPYSNGRIHLGQAFNKILKDFVVKFWSMNGYDSPYVPGWDTHGLPNELEAIKAFKIDRKAIKPVELREKCRDSAMHFVEVQREQFKRLGVRGDWENPYLTLDHTYEAAVVDAFGTLAQNGYIYRGKKPVHWCYTCETSLAEAEIEYKEKQSPSIYVKFPMKSGKMLDALKDAVKTGMDHSSKKPLVEGDPKKFEKAWHFLEKKNPFVVIWTTTPWTLPGNVAIAVHPDEEYSLAVSSDGEVYFLAEKRIAAVASAIGKSLEAVAGLKGKEVDKRIVCAHPFLDRDSVLICQNYVTMEEGTGCVHTAPGHGQDDFEAARLYELPVIVPVDDRGVLTEEAGPYSGLHVTEANAKIPEGLKPGGFLLQSDQITHSYPHCWRCRKPVIFRATEQWFVAVDHHGLREKTLQQIPQIKWHPSWGEERMNNTLEQRPDWCISRQRTWGIPLPVFYCQKCGKPVITPESIESVKSIFAKDGADSWFAREASELLPKDFNCPHCGSPGDFRKERDIFDVWFESGVSHLAVLETRKDLAWPGQLYLEGPDQYRGWFQVSLLSAMAVKGKPPYKEVLTHGWTLDLEGKAMHKSLGNAIDPMDVLRDQGADILRLFFSSVEFKNDIRIGEKLLKDTGEAYRKIRNTCRFLLGNLFDFEPAKHEVRFAEMNETDRWSLWRLRDLSEKVTRFYSNYEFHLVYYHLLNFCVNDMSALYFDVLKDRLYTFPADSKGRRSAQTALYHILRTLTRLVFPILSFTAEEIWQTLPSVFKAHSSVHLAEWPKLPDDYKGSEAFRARWEKILEIRNHVYAELETLRQQKIVKLGLETQVRLSLPEDEYALFANDEDLLTEFFIVSDLKIEKASGARAVKVEKHPGKKCGRCWHYHESISPESARFPGLDPRCLEVVEKTPVH